MRSVRYSTRPAFDSLDGLGTSIVTVPTFGFGILPCGPSMRPRRPTTGIMSGVAMATSKSVEAALDVLGQVVRADDVGAGLLGLARLVALGEHGDRHVLAEAVRERDRPAQLLVGVADVEAGADVHLDGLVELGVLELLDELTASAGGYSRSRSTCA